MSQEKNTRSEQARINGAKSKGPRTNDGLRRCGQVNLTHGAYAATVTVLDHEDPDAYAAIWSAAHDQYRPANAYEGMIVDMIVDHAWNHQRLVNAGNVYLRQQMAANRDNSPAGQHDDECHVRAEIDARHIETLERRARHHAREHARAIKTLQEARKHSTSIAGSQNYNELKDLVAKERAADRPETRITRPMDTAIWTPLAPPPAEYPLPVDPDPLQ
ncbi:MAG: hypothetical protein FJW30_29895 [Acidobacteria bacterium]|nr:hypothetical protein [Acidobacteriota bacterium]